MFDPQTTALIREAPALPQLDRDRLPEEFTKAFAAIVAFRIQLNSNANGQLPVELRDKLNEFRRMAATFETMVALLPERSDRQSAAFVAAQAQHLLHLARQAATPDFRPPPPLRADAISPEISSLLLFLIANQPSDALELARIAAKMRPNGDSASTLLVDALLALVSGNLSAIPPLIQRLPRELSGDSCEAAAEVLFRGILEGLVQLSIFLRDAREAQPAGFEATRIFRAVQRFAVQEEPWPFDVSDNVQLPPVSTFAGPHQLASLLLATTELLGASALSGIPVPPSTEPNAWKEAIGAILHERPFLWPNHLEAIGQGLLAPGTSAVVSFPTGAGKTTISELKAASTLARGGAVIYLAPTHALVAQLKTELDNVFPKVPVRESLLSEDFYAEVGESFGDSNAQIVVMTPERCLALLSLGGEEFKAVELVIFDECHLLHPRSGGQNRRSLDAMLALLHLQTAAPNADWLLLSAMMANADELAGWLGDLLRRPCLSLNLEWKPTRQVRGCLVYDQAAIFSLKSRLKTLENAARKPDGTLSSPTARALAAMNAIPYGFFCLQQTWQSMDVHNYTLLQLLEKEVPLGAAISAAKDEKGDARWRSWYLTPNKNKVAAHLAAQCARIGMKVLLFGQTPKDVGALAREIDSYLDCDSQPTTLSVPEQNLYNAALQEGGHPESLLTPSGCAGCHHALMLPFERELAERLFRRPEGITVLAATATLAQGMNLPADIVLIVGDERFDGERHEFSPLEAHELLNAAGRAGRAGLVAQGVVLVLPHKIVDFDPQKNQISEKWMNMQSSVFSRADQCLRIDDPILHLMDRVHDATTQDQPDVRYFIRRIPVGIEGDPDAPKRFLRSTLAAWRSKQKAESEQFDQIIERTLARREALRPDSHVETWRDEIAFKTGIELAFIEALHLELLRRVEFSPTTTEGWMRWFFGWLGHNKHWYQTVLGHRAHKDYHGKFEENDLFGPQLPDVLWAWMSGETLIQLNARLGGDIRKPRDCLQARKFVLRLVPELAFAAGLVARIRRKQIGENSDDLPLVVATFALCVREGMSEPELAAYKLENPNQILSRQRVQTEWSRIERFAQPRNEYEKFGRTRRRVLDAVNAWQSANSS